MRILNWNTQWLSSRSAVSQLRTKTLKGWLMPTSGIRQHYIDHVVMSTDLPVDFLRFISKFASAGQQPSDHNGVVIDLASADPRSSRNRQGRLVKSPAGESSTIGGRPGWSPLHTIDRSGSIFSGGISLPSFELTLRLGGEIK